MRHPRARSTDSNVSSCNRTAHMVRRQPARNAAWRTFVPAGPSVAEAGAVDAFLHPMGKQATAAGAGLAVPSDVGGIALRRSTGSRPPVCSTVHFRGTKSCPAAVADCLRIGIHQKRDFHSWFRSSNLTGSPGRRRLDILVDRLSALNTNDARNRNLAAVLELVREAPGRSRSEIGADMPFSLQTMTNVCQELIDLGLIEEFDRPRVRRKGNPHRGLRVVADGCFAVGVQMRWSSCELALVDLDLRVRDRRQVPILAAIDDAEVYVRDLGEAIAGLLNDHAGKAVWLIGLAGPLPILIPNATDQQPYLAPLWDDQKWFRRFWSAIPVDDLRLRLEGTLRLPVRIRNNPQAAGIAEALRLPVRARILYLLAGLGFGAAMISGRQVSTDIWPHSGEIGHVVHHGRTLSSVISATGVRQALGLAEPQGRYEAELERLLDAEPERFGPWLDEAAELLRFVVNFLENAIWPDGIALGGFLPDRLLDRLIGRLNPLDHSVVLPDSAETRLAPRLFRAERASRAIAPGVAAAVLSYRSNPALPALLGARRQRS
jgi:predicted NBD/HSP70 family sugar kinase